MIINLLLIVHILAALAIIGLVLLQQGKGADMGAAFGGGGAGSQSLFGSRGSSTFLSRATAIFALVFFLTSLTLAYMYMQRSGPSSVTDETIQVQTNPSDENASENEGGAVPAVETSPGSDTTESSSGDSAVPEVPVESGTETESSSNSDSQ